MGGTFNGSLIAEYGGCGHSVELKGDGTKALIVPKDCPACQRNREIFRRWMEPFINSPEPAPPKVVESLAGQMGLDLGA